MAWLISERHISGKLAGRALWHKCNCWPLPASWWLYKWHLDRWKGTHSGNCRARIPPGSAPRKFQTDSRTRRNFTAIIAFAVLWYVTIQIRAQGCTLPLALSRFIDTWRNLFAYFSFLIINNNGFDSAWIVSRSITLSGGNSPATVWTLVTSRRFYRRLTRYVTNNSKRTANSCVNLRANCACFFTIHLVLYLRVV